MLRVTLGLSNPIKIIRKTRVASTGQRQGQPEAKTFEVCGPLLASCPRLVAGSPGLGFVFGSCVLGEANEITTSSVLLQVCLAPNWMTVFLSGLTEVRLPDTEVTTEVSDLPAMLFVAIGVSPTSSGSSRHCLALI